MNNQESKQVSITLDKIILRFEDMEPVVIPRSALRTRLRLLDWIYRLTGWPGMNVRRLRTFIEVIFRHRGWSLPDPEDDHLPTSSCRRESEPRARTAAVASA